MGKYRDLLISAKHNNSEAVMELYKRCQPTIKKYSYVNGKFDEDLYQNLVIAFLGVIEKFKITESGASAPLFLLFVVNLDGIIILLFVVDD